MDNEDVQERERKAAEKILQKTKLIRYVRSPRTVNTIEIQSVKESQHGTALINLGLSESILNPLPKPDSKEPS
jgi:hypothetical protein